MPTRDHKPLAASQSNSARTRAFTLTELLIAVAVLVIVIIATARIFGTASQITGIGQATSDVMTEAAAIERQLRSDLSRLSHEGFFAIRHVAVRNDVNGPTLLNPELPDDAIIRADQLVFFANGVEGSQTAYQGHGRHAKMQGTEAFVYYGHAFQIPDARPIDQGSINQGFAYDAHPNDVVTPWTSGAIDMVRTNFQTGGGGGTGFYSFSAAGSHPLLQPGARQWLLVRQPVIFGDDDSQAANQNSKTVLASELRTARSLLYTDPLAGLCPQIRDGRVDGAATELPEIRRRIQMAGAWLGATGQRQTILDDVVIYPRAERVAPSTHRVDQALTNAVIASACSSFRIDWTYDLGTGAATNADGTSYLGVSNDGVTGGASVDLYEPGNEIRWFGYPDPDRGVFPYSYDQWPDTWDGGAETIFIDNIEDYVQSSNWVEQYNYVFGFNQSRPFIHPITGLPDELYGLPDVDAAYTPWPNALRVTMRLHDRNAKLEGGREIQFIVRLPKRQ